MGEREFFEGIGFSQQAAHGDDARQRPVIRQRHIPEDLQLCNTDLSRSTSHIAALQLIGQWKRN